jgi:predicted RNase H-like HicB family nuclease
MEMIYKAVIEGGGTSWSAFVPDIPGCVAAASSRKRVEELIRGAVEVHIEVLREIGEPVPLPTTTDGTIDVTAA